MLRVNHEPLRCLDLSGNAPLRACTIGVEPEVHVACMMHVRSWGLVMHGGHGVYSCMEVLVCMVYVH